MKSLFKTIVVLLGFTIAGIAFGNDLAKADAFYTDGNIKEALEIYLKPENRDKPLVQNRIGNIYSEQPFSDRKKANEWFQKSADQGNQYAQFNLGLAYKNGLGVMTNYTKAMQLFTQSAKQGNASAMNSIAVIYENGLGVTKDEDQAIKWYGKAIEGGNTKAMCNISGLLMHGKNKMQNYEAIHTILGWCLRDEPDNECCLNRMAAMYSNGWGVKKDFKKAYALRLKAANNGSEYAMFSVGVHHDYGMGTTKDPKAAMDWYLKAAEKNEPKAMYRLYEVFAYGKLGQAVDKAKASEWKARAEKAMKEQGVVRDAGMDSLRLKMEEMY